MKALNHLHKHVKQYARKQQLFINQNAMRLNLDEMHALHASPFNI